MMRSFSLVSSGIMSVALIMLPMLAPQAQAGISASINVVNGQPGVAVAYHPDYGFGHYPTTTYVHSVPTRVVGTYGYDTGYGAVYPTQTVTTTTTTTYTQYPNTVIYQSAVVVPPPVVIRRPVVVVAQPRCYSASNWRCIDQGYYPPSRAEYRNYRDHRRAPKKVTYVPVNVPHSR